MNGKRTLSLPAFRLQIAPFITVPAPVALLHQGMLWSSPAGWRASTAKSAATATGWETETEGIKATSPEILHTACWCLTARTAG